MQSRRYDGRVSRNSTGGEEPRPHGGSTPRSVDAGPSGPGQVHGGDESDAARVSDIRTKALAGVAIITGRNMSVKLLALAGTVVFARLLSPSQFGAVAFGLTILTLAQVFSDGGLGVGLIRRQAEPERDELQVLLGYQLILTVSLAAVIAAVAAPLGRSGVVTAIMMAALPFLAFRTPSMIVLERELRFGPVARAEVVQEVTYYVWGVIALALGAGVWGLATASVVKAAIGSYALLRVSPVAGLRPSYSFAKLRPMLGYGLRFQAVQLVNAGGIQALNTGVVLVGGLASLGIWTLAWRLLQIPFLLFSVLWRVSYPASARLLGAGESARHLIDRSLGLAAVATGAILAPTTGALFPLVSVLFGHRWTAVADILVPLFFALQVSGPVSVSCAGFLYAVGETMTVLRAAIVGAVVWPLIALPLLKPLGPVSLGLGGMIACFLEVAILSRATRRRTGASFREPLLTVWACTTAAGAAGWAASRLVGTGVLAAVVGGLVGLAAYAVPIALLRREALQSLARLSATAFSSVRDTHDAATPVSV